MISDADQKSVIRELLGHKIKGGGSQCRQNNVIEQERRGIGDKRLAIDFIGEAPIRLQLFDDH